MSDKELCIRLKDGDKEAELRISSSQDWERLALIQCFLDFFHIDSHFSDMADVYFKTSDRFKEYLESINPSEKVTYSLPDKLEVYYPVSEFTDPSTFFDTGVKQQQSYYLSGIRETPEGITYKCRYHCPCGLKNNQYILPSVQHIFCFSCRATLDVYPASPLGVVNSEQNPEDFRDSFGNFFIAGTLVDKYFDKN